MFTTLGIERGNIENAVIRVSEEIEINSNHIKSWVDLTEKQLWTELVGCILGSQVKFETSEACVAHLNRMGLLRIKPLIENSDSESIIENELKKQIYPPFKGERGSMYRYYKSKSSMIIKTAISIYKTNMTTIKSVLIKSNDEFDARDKLIDMCFGIGMKQASLFLRNVNYSRRLAILDSHVIKFMSELNLYHFEKTVTKTRYMYAEKILRKYSDSLDKDLATLDVAIWIVMKVVKEEFS